MPPALRNWETFSQALFGHQPLLPEYHGFDHENPVRYLERCTEYVEAYTIADQQRVKALEKGLKGEAEKWWQCYRGMEVDYARYQNLLTNRFDNETIRSDLISRLYGKKQTEHEPVGPFLQQKYMLYQRLRPDEPEATRITTLISLLNPSLRRAMRAHQFDDFSELLTKVLQAEQDEDDGTGQTKKAKKEAPAEASKGTKKTGNAPKCWHCPEFHFHRDCPVFKEKQKGNWREAAGRPVDAAPDNPDRK